MRFLLYIKQGIEPTYTTQSIVDKSVHNLLIKWMFVYTSVYKLKVVRCVDKTLTAINKFYQSCVPRAQPTAGENKFTVVAR